MTTQEVYLNSKNELKIKVDNAFVGISNVTEFTYNEESSIFSWSPFEDEGYQRHIKGGSAGTISMSGIVRDYLDAGNNAIASTMGKVGADAEKDFQWTAPDGTVSTFSGVVEISSIGGAGGEPEQMDVTIHIQGKPVVSA